MSARGVILVAICLFLAGCGNDRDVTRGAALYAANCAVCHGGDLRGGGGAGVVGLGQTPADLTMLARNSQGEFPTAHVLTLLQDYAAGTQVRRRMRPFSDLTSEESIRLRVDGDRRRVPEPQAALLAYLEAAQSR